MLWRATTSDPGTMNMDTAHLLAHCEFKLAGAPADAMTFNGYGATFGNVDAYGDVIERGAFSAWLQDVKGGKQRWPAMLSQHGGFGVSADDMTPVGTWVELGQDERGLKVKGKLADTPRGRELYALMKMAPPAIDGLSIGYIAKEWEPRSKPDDPRRKLKRIDVMEISPVTFPANTQARVTGVKSAAAASGQRPHNVRELEASLHALCGFSEREAKRMASAAWGAFTRQDPSSSAELDELARLLRHNTALLRR